MAKYRPIFTKIWNDPDFEENKHKGKLIFIYLCTNPSTTESGIYAVSCKSISQATGIKLKEVEDALRNNRIKNVLYDTENKVVFVCNFFRYNGRGRPDLVIKSILNDYNYIKTSLWDEFKKHYPHYFEEMSTLSEQLEKGSIPNPNPKPIPKPNPTHTTYLSAGESADKDRDSKKTPVDKMRSIFVKYWQYKNDGSYLSNPEKEKLVAEKLYKHCLKDNPKKPLMLFEDKVENLVSKHDIKHFSGLEAYWNAGTKSWFHRKFG